MKTNWLVYYQNNGKGIKWTHKTFDTRFAAEYCLQKKVEDYSEDTDTTVERRTKKGDIEGCHMKGFASYAAVPREWCMYWGLREIEVPEDDSDD